MYRLRTTALYDRQVEDLSPEANALLVRKVEMLLRDPAQFKGGSRGIGSVSGSAIDASRSGLYTASMMAS